MTIYTCGFSKIPGRVLKLTHPTPARSTRIRQNGMRAALSDEYFRIIPKESKDQ